MLEQRWRLALLAHEASRLLESCGDVCVVLGQPPDVQVLVAVAAVDYVSSLVIILHRRWCSMMPRTRCRGRRGRQERVEAEIPPARRWECYGHKSSCQCKRQQANPMAMPLMEIPPVKTQDQAGKRAHLEDGHVPALLSVRPKAAQIGEGPRGAVADGHPRARHPIPAPMHAAISDSLAFLITRGQGQSWVANKWLVPHELRPCTDSCHWPLAPRKSPVRCGSSSWTLLICSAMT